MTATRFRFWLPGLLALLGSACLAAPAAACPFCGSQGETLTQAVNQASMVLYGTFKNGQLDNNTGKGSTELHIEAVIKKHDFLGDKKMVLVPRYIPTDKDKPPRYLVFCDVFKGNLDVYRGMPVSKDTSDIVLYLTGLLAIKEKDVASRLAFTFNYLDNADPDVAGDAFKEWGNADYDQAYRDVARTLPADKLARWLEDPNTPSYRLGTYASLLGHCGTEKHADLLRKLLDDPQRRLTSGIDGMLSGYVLLRPKEGYEYLLSIIKNPKKEFLYRYAALRALRFFWVYRPEVLPKMDLQKGVEALLDQGDIADLAIEDLRKWQCWDATERVLALADRPSHDVPIIRRAILRFALSCQDKQPRAAAFVKQMRQKDDEWVKDVEDVLKLDSAK